jgi:hypothetical protein
VNGIAANDRGGQLPISTYVELNAHEGLNAIKYDVPTSGHLFISNGDAKITIEKGYVYTLSCMAKYTGQSTNSSGGVFGVRLENVKLSSITSVGENKDIYGVGGSSHTEIYFGKVGDIWTKRSYSFSVKDSHEGDSITFRLCGYAWGKDITVYYSQLKLEVSSVATPYVKHVDDNKGDKGDKGDQGPQGPEGKEGPIGQTGPMLIHDGNYDATKFYKLSLDENGKVIGKICVYLNAKKGDGTYLILKKSMDDRFFVMGEDGYVYPATSTGIRIDESNTEYWSKAPYTEQTFTRFLLANWAEFGSSEGAVFYGKHLFSQLGLGANGEIGSYYDYTSQMFDQNGDLTSEFVPNYFVDFKTGETKLGRLTESYLHLSANQAYHYKIDPSKAHNVAIHKVSGTNGSNSFSIPTIILPKENQVLDGVHCSIAHEFGFSSSWYEDSRNSTVFVCADEGIFSHDKSDVGYKSGWMVWKGYLVKFAFLAPGTVLNLRSVRNSTYGLLWNIENAEDFYAMKSDMLIVDEVSYDTGSTAGRGYIRLDKSIYEHQYSNPSVTRINNNNWWYKDVEREREDFLCIGSHVFSEYSEIKQWVTGVGNEFKKGEMRWVLLKDQQDGKYGHIRHLGTYDIPIPDFKQSDKTTI